MDDQAMQLLEELRSVLLNSKKALFSNQHLVDRDELVELIDTIIQVLPQEYTGAVDIMRQENRVLQNANRYAESKIAETDAQARQMLQEAQVAADGVLLDAKRRANEMEQHSREQATRTQEAAQRKADELVAQTEIMRRAELQANESIVRARADADRVYLMNLDHCEAMLKQVEDKAVEVANLVRASRNQLSESR